MKNIGISLFTLLLVALSCKKKDGLYEFGNLQIGSYLTLTKTNNLTIKFDDQASSKVSIEVGSKGSPVESVNVYVVEGASLNKASWKLIKNVPFTEGMTLEVTPAQIVAALGVPLKPGGTYTMYNEVVTKDGRKFSSANMDPDFEAQAGYSMGMTWTATTTCPFDRSVFAGDFSVTKDSWADYDIGALVKVEPGPGANQITIYAYPSPAFGNNRKGVVLDVNPATSAVTIPTQVVGDYFPADKDVTMEGIGSVNSCQKLITITGIKFGQGGSIFATGHSLTLKKG
ncbi:MAG TPA: hypothetical protein VM843_06550 [Flavisolibacter sp.]|jgi:hypothetical protein|nr:hypothetical protein [Flavisolibacter sp.]